MTNFIFTLGFNTSALTKCLVREDVDEGDIVHILRPSGERDDRGKQAVNDVEEFLSKIGKIDLKVHNLHPDTPYRSTIKIIDLINQDAQRIVVGITGGGRELVLPLVISTITLSKKIDDFYAFTDVDQRLRKFEIPNLLFKPDEKDIKILEKTKKTKMIKNLAEELELSQSTISRRCSKLLENKLLESKRKGKNKTFKITTPGEIILKVHKPSVLKGSSRGG